MYKAALLVAAPFLLGLGSVAIHRSDQSRPSYARGAMHGIRLPVSDDTVAKLLYEKNCRKCHGPNGEPSKAMLKKFSKIETFDAAFFSKRSDDSITTVLANGTKKDMKSFKNKLSHDEMKAVAAYIRTFGK